MSSDTAMTDVVPPAASLKRKLDGEDGPGAASTTAATGATAAASSSADGSSEPAEKKQKISSTGPSVTLASPSKPPALATPGASPKPGAATSTIPRVIPKKVAVPVQGSAKLITPAAKPAVAGAKPVTPGAAKPATPATTTTSKSSSSTTSTTPKPVTPKPKVKVESKSDSSSSSSESDDEPLVASAKKAPPPKKAAAPTSPKVKVEPKSTTTEEKKSNGSEKAAAAPSSPKPKPAAKKVKKEAEEDSSSSSSSDSDDSSSDSDDDSSSDSDSSDSGSDSSSVSDSSDSDASEAPKRKKRAPVKRATATPRKSTTAAPKKAKATKTKRPKADGEESGSESSEDEGFDETKIILYPMDKYEIRSDIVPLKETQGANKWWNRLRAPEDTRKWTTLEHNGILFPAEYVPHKQPLIYDGQEIILNVEAEEVASMWAGMLDTVYVKNPTFAKNFFRDFKATLPKDSPITDLAKCDFTIMAKHITTERENLKLFRKADKRIREREKKEKDELQNIYGYCLVDGFKEKVGNFRVEPPSLFRGRGDHPKTGTLKHRVRPEEIIINISTGMPIPKPPVGHKWKGIIHNNKVTWLAFYKDNVNGDFKYIWLAPSSRFKGESDIKKYTKAQTLKKHIDMIRKSYVKEMKSQHSQFRQRATAIYLIDFLALRVGNEKDTTEVADTVGCCSLRVEHLTFQAPRTVTFDFLGKDSMRYHNTVELDQTAYDNLVSFTAKKKPTELIFDNLTTTLLNEHLKSLMPGLTAKVFRTYNASITLQNELRNPENDISASEHQTTKVNFYNRANREVAILCNHQRSVPKGHEVAVARLREQIESIQDEKEELEDWIADFKKSKDKAGRSAREEKRQERREARLAKAREEAKQKKLKEKAERAKLRAAGKEVEPSDDEEDEDWGVKEKTRSKPADLDKAEAMLKKVTERLISYEARLSLRDENKEVALGTSKINYMDPRITVAWCKAKEVPLEAVFNKALVAKFPWAMEVPPDWTF